MTNEEKAAYLAAFIDGEGHVGLSHKIKRTGFTREISCCNTDKALIDAVAQMFRDLDFSISIYFKSRTFPEKSQWTIRFAASKDHFERFQRLIPIQAPRKITMLQEIIDSYRDPISVMEQRRLGREIKCAQCGGMFYRPPSVEAQFCSLACMGKASIRRTSKVCQQCGKHYEVILAKKKSKFCSLRCSGKAQSARLSALGKATIANARAARLKGNANPGPS